MVSHFVEDKDGYLALSDEQYNFEVMNTDQEVEMSACVLLYIGENREEYWNSDLFLEQIPKLSRLLRSNTHHPKITTTPGVLTTVAITLPLLMMPYLLPR